MKPLIFFLSVFIVTPTLSSIRQRNYSKKVFELGTVEPKDYLMKIDGGCGFYSLSEAGLKNKFFLFVISWQKTGFFSIKGTNKQVFLKQVSKHRLKNGYSLETFLGEGFKVEIKTKPVNIKTPSERQGTIEISNKAHGIRANVYGEVDYAL